jgi:RNA polymerase sigma factor for flagellar operon FliA
MSASVPAPESPLPATLLRIVRAEAWSIRNRLPDGVVSQEELEQLGHVGLLEARESFDPRRGVPFEHFARHRIRGSMWDGLRQLNMMSRRVWHSLRREALAHEAAGEPAPVPAGGPDPAQDAKVVYSAIVQMALSRLADEMLPEPTIDEVVEEEETRSTLRAAFARLPDEDRQVLAAVYDLKEQGDSGAALARRRGMSRSTVSRLHIRALERLKRLMEVPP